MSETAVLVLFNIFIVAMLVLDFGVIQRKAHFPTMKEAIGWSIVWISLALCFGAFLWHEYGTTRALEFFTGYIVEEALSVDNVFVFILIFNYFAVPKEAQHKVLFWGVLSAIVFRAIFIVAGAALVSAIHWILYVLGAFLIYTAVRLAVQDNEAVHPDKNPFIRLARKILPITRDYHGSAFVVRRDGGISMTPLLIVLLMIETTDIAFATDSIPAIFAITRDTFIIFTSNIFAVLGLRALYFVVAGYLKEFRFLKYGLSAVLGFIGVKMIIEPWFKISIVASLLTIFLSITAAILASVASPGEKEKAS